MKDLKIVYYMNRFFGGEGGEESASEGIAVFEGTKGISGIFESAYGDDCKVAATIICGDNYIAENLDKVCDEIIEIVKKYSPDAFGCRPCICCRKIWSRLWSFVHQDSRKAFDPHCHSYE